MSQWRLWDREELRRDGVARSADSKRRLVAPDWFPE